MNSEEVEAPDSPTDLGHNDINLESSLGEVRDTLVMTHSALSFVGSSVCRMLFKSFIVVLNLDILDLDLDPAPHPCL